MLKTCRFCNQTKDYNHWRQFAAHSTNCNFNPHYERRKEKLRKSNTVKRKNYKFKCLKCNKIFDLYLTESQYLQNKYKKHCSYKCSNSKIQTKAMNRKRSEKLNGIRRGFSKISYYGKEIRYCEICNKKFKIKKSLPKKTCGKKECISKSISRNKKLNQRLMIINYEIIQYIFKKYKEICQDCKKKIKKGTKTYIAHHLDMKLMYVNYEKYMKTKNRILLCSSCHKKRHNKEILKNAIWNNI